MIKNLMMNIYLLIKLEIRHSIESIFLFRKKIFKTIYYEILYRYKYSKSNHFFKPPDNYPAPYFFIYKICKFINKKEISGVVDLGCGNGRLTNFLSDMTKAKIYGYEIDKETYQVADQNKNHNVTIVNKNILDIDFKSLDVECFIFNGPLYKSEHRSDFEILIGKIHDSKKTLSKKYYIIGINLDEDTRHKAEDRNYIFSEKNLSKTVTAGPNKRIKFFEYGPSNF
jgi:predicted RNA methylase